MADALSDALDDLVRLAVARALRDAGLSGASIPSVFDALETPPSLGHRWRWLQSDEARRDGAILLCIAGHPAAPNPAAGGVLLTTIAAATLLQQRWEARRGVRVTAVDVGQLIAQLEATTGEAYRDSSPDTQVPRERIH